jgi:hypothetical protein
MKSYLDVGPQSLIQWPGAGSMIDAGGIVLGLARDRRELVRELRRLTAGIIDLTDLLPEPIPLVGIHRTVLLQIRLWGRNASRASER